MRRVTLFIGSLTAVLALGAAVAFAAGPLSTVASDTEAEATSSGFFVADDTSDVLEPRDEPADKPVEEPAVEQKNDDTGEAFVAEEPKEEPPAEEPKDEAPEEPKEEDDADTTPPEIVILHPTDGQVFETEKVAFEGEAEPGSRVFAGDWEADVSDSGAWRIVLILQPGSNVATITAVDAAGNEGTDRVQVFYEPGTEPLPAEPPKDEPPHDDKPPKEEEPHDKDFTAHQLYGSCGEDVPYDVFYGTGTAGVTVTVSSDYGSATAVIGEHGEWEVRVDFPTAPRGEKFTVLLTTSDGHVEDFWFKATGESH